MSEILDLIAKPQVMDLGATMTSGFNMAQNMAKMRAYGEQIEAEKQSRIREALMNQERMAAVNNPTPANIRRLMLLNPEAAQGYAKAYEAMSAEQKDADKRVAWNVYIAGLNKRPDIMRQTLKDAATAARNSGQEDIAVNYDAYSKMPDNELTLQSGALLYALGEGEALNKFGESRRAEDLHPWAVRKQAADAVFAEGQGERWQAEYDLDRIKALAQASADRARAAGGVDVKDVSALRKEFEDSDPVKAYVAALPYYQSVLSAPDTGAGDINAAYAVGKIMDPKSVVRDGELKLVGASQNVVNELLGRTWKELENASAYTPEARKAIRDMLENHMRRLGSAYTSKRAQMIREAERLGIEPDRLVGDAPKYRRSDFEAPTSSDNIPAGAKAMLRSNPALRGDFDKKYGAGAAARVLGK